MFRYAFFATVLSLGGFAADLKKGGNCPDGQGHYRTTIRHIESGGIGYEDGYTTLELFLASDPTRWKVTPFFDARAHVFDNGKWAANAGIGLRALWGNRAYGINTYYDYRKTSRLTLNQIGAGLETLGELFDFRINGYLPVGKKTSTPYGAEFVAFSGHYMIVSQKYQSGMKGADAEFGFHFGKSESLDFYAAAGPYYFIGEVAEPTWGGKARISGTYKDLVRLEISDSYDRTFHNKFQGEIALTFTFGPKSNVKEQGRTCKTAYTLNSRMLQPVNRQEIIVMDTPRKETIAFDPTTGLPYFFVFVDNTSSSDGTYESPYHNFTQAQDNSSPYDIIYVFPGDGTTTGMNSGIALKPYQKFWGSGVSHSIQTTGGTTSIPPQSSSSPTITNTNIDTDMNAITLGAHNSISGFTIASASNDGIYGTDPQTLDVSNCTFIDTTTFAIEATFSSDATISLTNNLFLNNVNGIILTLQGTSEIECVGNTFDGQTSVSSFPLTLLADHSSVTARIKNNFFNGNRTGAVLGSLDHAINTNISLLNNSFTGNRSGSLDSLGSTVTVQLTGMDPSADDCAILLVGNTFSNNERNAFYMPTAGSFTTLAVTAAQNTFSDCERSALVFSTPVDNLFTLSISDNTISRCGDNSVSIIATASTSPGNITIRNNTITDIDFAGTQSAIVFSQDFSTLDLNISNNEIARCGGTGIASYQSVGIDSLRLNIAENTISNCENRGSNAASAISIERYTSLTGSIINNTLSDNAGLAVVIQTDLANPTACLNLTGNRNTGDYTLGNPVDGTFRLSPCNVNEVNTGTINLSGTITGVQSCTNTTPCP